MKKQDKQKLAQSTVAELQAKLKTLKQELIVLSQKTKLGKLENKKQVKNTRYQIALINTYLNQKQQQKKLKEQS